MKRIAILSFLSIVLTGCAFTPQAVTVQPKVDVATSQLGGNKSVTLNVVDERPKKTLGTVGASNVGADISIDGDLVAAIQSSLNDGLSRVAFKPSADRSGNKNELRVEIRNLDYTIIRGFWAGTLRVDAGLKGICIKDGTRPYEKLHHGEYVSNVQVVQGAEANSQYVNTAVSGAVNSLLSDKELIACLASNPASLQSSLQK